MTREERQTRAWIDRVFRHAAIRWIRNQTRQRGPVRLSWDDKEVSSLWLPTSSLTNSDVSLSLAVCRAHLTLRDRQILESLMQGQAQVEIARQLHCSTRTVRRATQEIRRRCR